MADTTSAHPWLGTLGPSNPEGPLRSAFLQRLGMLEYNGELTEADHADLALYRAVLHAMQDRGEQGFCVWCLDPHWHPGGCPVRQQSLRANGRIA